VHYYAQLVSVEGFQDYLGPTAKPIPQRPSGGGPQDAQLVSLYGWTFTSQPGPGLSFSDLVAGLIASERVTPALRLPAPPSVQLPPAASARIQDGYAPLPFVTGAGEQSFAWYRGPFTPVVPQPLPQVGDPPLGVDEATSADALMIYLAKQGLFDLSYAAAWNIGRQLALADAQFAQTMSRYRREARGALGRLAQRMTGDQLAEAADPVSAWLANLSLLGSVPFSYLVPDPRILPAESVRFFYVDQGWIDALVAGATSIAVHATADVALLRALRPRLHEAVAVHRVSIGAPAGGTGMTGMLLRSALVSGWPALVVRATLGGAPLPIVRNDWPSPSVRLCLFDGVPDEVSLAEPYQGLIFGLEDGVVGPRNVTATGAAGAQIANLKPLTPTFRTPPGNAAGGVLEVAALAAALETAVGVRQFTPRPSSTSTAQRSTPPSSARAGSTRPCRRI
jgi:hypothetical protein